MTQLSISPSLGRFKEGSRVRIKDKNGTEIGAGTTNASGVASIAVLTNSAAPLLVEAGINGDFYFDEKLGIDVAISGISSVGIRALVPDHTAVSQVGVTALTEIAVGSLATASGVLPSNLSAASAVGANTAVEQSFGINNLLLPPKLIDSVSAVQSLGSTTEAEKYAVALAGLANMAGTGTNENALTVAHRLRDNLNGIAGAAPASSVQAVVNAFKAALSTASGVPSATRTTINAQITAPALTSVKLSDLVSTAGNNAQLAQTKLLAQKQNQQPTQTEIMQAYSEAMANYASAIKVAFANGTSITTAATSAQTSTDAALVLQFPITITAGTGSSNGKVCVADMSYMGSSIVKACYTNLPADFTCAQAGILSGGGTLQQGIGTYTFSTAAACPAGTTVTVSLGGASSAGSATTTTPSTTTTSSTTTTTSPVTTARYWTPQANNGGIAAIAASPTLYVGVGDGGLIKTSSDGTTWTLRDSGTMENLRGVTWSGTQFVAVGGDGIRWTTTPAITVSTGVILTSNDGISWTKRNSGIPSSGVSAGIGYPNEAIKLNGVTYGGGTYVAVGYSNIGSPIALTSTDGVSWSLRSVLNGSGLMGVTWSGSQFIAIGNSCSNGCAATNTGKNIFTSPDGNTWTQRTSSLTTGLKSIACSSSSCVVVGESNTIASVVLTSTDGITWSVGSLPGGFTTSYTGGLNSVTWAGTQYIATGIARTTNLPTMITSADGVTWTSKTYTASAISTVARPVTFEPVVSYNNGRYIVAQGTEIFLSTDAATWTKYTSGESGINYFNKVIFGNGKFVATRTVSDLATGNQDGQIVYSTDGKTWTRATITGLTGRTIWNGGIIWTGSQFLAINGGASTQYIATSSDGITWTATNNSSIATNAVNDVAYGNGMYVAVGGKISTSTDGVNWTHNTTTANTQLAAGYPLQSIVFSEGKFITVGQALNSTNNKALIYSSIDGLNWSLATVSASSMSGLRGVVFGNAQYIALTSYGTGSFITSSNAATWNVGTTTTGSATPKGSDIAFGDGLFVTVGSRYSSTSSATDNHGYISTSADGKTWIENIASGTPLTSITYGNGTFVAVGGKGSVYTSP
jgi:hypothetical protein